jgi:hypothetical protein
MCECGVRLEDGLTCLACEKRYEHYEHSIKPLQ